MEKQASLDNWRCGKLEYEHSGSLTYRVRLLTQAELLKISECGVSNLSAFSTSPLSDCDGIGVFTGLLNKHTEVMVRIRFLAPNQFESPQNQYLDGLSAVHSRIPASPWLQKIYETIELDSAIAIVTTRARPIHTLLGTGKLDDLELTDMFAQISIMLIKLQQSGVRIAALSLESILMEETGDIVLGAEAEILSQTHSKRALVPPLLTCFIEYLLLLGETYPHIQPSVMAIRGIALSIAELPDSSNQLGLLVQALGKRKTTTSRATEALTGGVDKSTWSRPLDFGDPTRERTKRTRFLFKMCLSVSAICVVAGLLVTGIRSNSAHVESVRKKAGSEQAITDDAEILERYSAQFQEPENAPSEKTPNGGAQVDANHNARENSSGKPAGPDAPGESVEKPHSPVTQASVPTASDLERILQLRADCIEQLLKRSKTQTAQDDVASALLGQVYEEESEAYKKSLEYVEQLRAREIEILDPVVELKQFAVDKQETLASSATSGAEDATLQVKLIYTMRYKIKNAEETVSAEEEEQARIELTSTKDGWKIVKVLPLDG